MKKRTYKERFQIPLDGDPNINFYTKSGLLLAKGYVRIVIGGRGPYIEFSTDQIQHENIFVPDHAKYKLEDELAYYHEYRSKDDTFTKLYYQKGRVSYADYKIEMWYIDPDILITDDFKELMLPLYVEDKKENKEENKEDKPNLFDLL